MGGEAASDPGRLGLELGVGHLGAVRDEGGAVGTALRSLGQPVVEFHRRDIVPIMPQRHKEAPPEQDLYAPIEWRSAGEYGDIRYEKADGIAKITIDRPEVLNAFRPQTLVEISAALELAREDTEVGVVDPHRRGDAGVLLGRRPAGPRRQRLRRRGRLARPLPRHRPAGADAAAAEAGGGDGRRLRGRRRPRAARLLRPDDRRRQRPLRPDRAAGRLLGRRLRRLPAARPGRDQAGEGALAALPPVRRR